MESRKCCYIQRPGLPGFDKLAENDALWSVESFPLVEQILLDYLVRSLHVDWHHSQPFRRLWTIPGVVDIYLLHSPRPATRILRQKSTWRSRVSSSELVQSQCARSYRAHLSSREIAMSTSDAASEWWSVESEVRRYPQRPGSSSFDDVVENGAVRHMGPRGVKSARRRHVAQ